MQTVTREHKLALIVGFSLILLVGVLISDHLSRARQARIASVGGADAGASISATPPTADLMKPLDAELSRPSAHTQPPAPAVQEPPVEPARALQQPVQVAKTESPAQPPVTIAQGGGRQSSDARTPLEEAINQHGGSVSVDQNGNRTINLPPAVGLKPEANLVKAPAPTSPIGAPDTKAGTNVPAKVHAVQKGETMFQIARTYYSNGHLWRELAKYNGVANKEGSVREGTKLRIPAKDVLLGKAPAAESKAITATPKQQPAPTTKPVPGKRLDGEPVKPKVELATYTVKKGETLGDISRKLLGTSKRWQELAEFNKIDDEDSIAAGTVLKVPPMRG